MATKKVSCGRCDGTGTYVGFGVCYRCNGAGKVNPTPERAPQPQRVKGTPAQEWALFVKGSGLADACTLAAVNPDYAEFKAFARAEWHNLPAHVQAHIRGKL